MVGGEFPPVISLYALRNQAMICGELNQLTPAAFQTELRDCLVDYYEKVCLMEDAGGLSSVRTKKPKFKKHKSTTPGLDDGPGDALPPLLASTTAREMHCWRGGQNPTKKITFKPCSTRKNVGARPPPPQPPPPSPSLRKRAAAEAKAAAETTPSPAKAPKEAKEKGARGGDRVE